MSWRPKITWDGVGRVIFAYLVVCAFMWLYQRNLMYIPHGDIAEPQAYGLQEFSDHELTTDDGQAVHVWYRKAKEGFPTLVHFHGNAGNLSHRAYFFKLAADAGFGVLGLDYRGFGKSTGKPYEEGLYMDARETLHYAMGELKVPAKELILYGESLGTGIAVQMATECECAALVLQSPYTSIENVAQETYPWLPVRMLIQDRYNSLRKVKEVKEPTLIMHGEADTLIDVSHAKELFAALPEPKQAVYFPGKGHNDLSIEEMVKQLEAFSRKQGIIN